MRTILRKPSVLLAFFLFIALSSQAQMKWRVCSMISEKATVSSGKTTYTTTDSIVYYYNPLYSRGSDTMATAINADSSLSYSPNTTKPWSSVHIAYNSSNQKLNVHSVYRNIGTDTLTADTFAYSGGLLVSKTSAGIFAKSGVNHWVTKTVTKYQYNTQKQLIYIDYYDFLKTLNKPLTNTIKTYRKYDAAGRIICDSTRKFNFNLNQWENYEFTYFTYDVNGTLSLTSKYQGPSCGEVVLTYYIYQSDTKKIADSTFLLTNYGKPDNFAAITRYGYDNKGRLKSKYYYNSSTKQISFGYVYAYTSFGYLAAIEEQQMSSANIVEPTERTRYNYQAHWPTAITNAASETNNLMLFPVPAQDYLTINWLVNEQTVIHGMITDMQGRQVASWTDEASGVYNKTITTQNLPSGQYNLQLYTTGDVVQKSFTVIK
ncbi:MAG: T9SS type A sorting domain-containing protein [Flavipsychrobacter sp.]